MKAESVNLTLCRPDSNIVKCFVNLPVRSYMINILHTICCLAFIFMISSCDSPHNEQCRVLCVWSTNSHTIDTRHSDSAYYIVWHVFESRNDIAYTGHGVRSPYPEIET